MSNSIKKVFFEWLEYNYGACFECNFILLKALQNDYVALAPDLSKSLDIILNHSFIKEKNKYNLFDKKTLDISSAKINSAIDYFIKNNILKETTIPNRNNFIATPKEKGGLREREWNSLNVKSGSNLKLTLKAFFILYKVHSIIRKKQMIGIIRHIESVAASVKTNTPTYENSHHFARALDIACLFYPKKTMCLPFASALALLHYKNGYKCDFIIGVQNLPFYAHAWIEVEGKVINDREELKNKLAPILRISG